MSRIRIKDLPSDIKISKEEVRRAHGGGSLSDYILRVGLDAVVQIGPLTALGSEAEPKLEGCRDAVPGADSALTPKTRYQSSWSWSSKS